MAHLTRTLSIDRDDPDSTSIEAAAEIIRSGGLVAFATETVYGLGVDATNHEAIERLYEAKGRPAHNPLIVHVDTLERARDCVVFWPEAAETLARAFWPGPLTLVLPRSSIIPAAVTAGRETVGVRMPEPAVARHLISRAGRPIAAPSANRSTGVSPTIAAHVLADLDGRIDLILDSGQTTLGLESTVLDLTTREPRILRPGPLTAHEIHFVLGGVHVRHADGDTAAVDEPAASPGQMPVHYSPRTPAFRLNDLEELAELDWSPAAALLVVGPHFDLPLVPSHVRRFELPTPELAARDLYATFHECDALQLDQLIIVPPADLPEWHTLRDRLWRATRPLNPGS